MAERPNPWERRSPRGFAPPQMTRPPPQVARVQPVLRQPVPRTDEADDNFRGPQNEDEASRYHDFFFRQVTGQNSPRGRNQPRGPGPRIAIPRAPPGGRGRARYTYRQNSENRLGNRPAPSQNGQNEQRQQQANQHLQQHQQRQRQQQQQTPLQALHDLVQRPVSRDRHRSHSGQRTNSFDRFRSQSQGRENRNESRGRSMSRGSRPRGSSRGSSRGGSNHNSRSVDNLTNEENFQPSGRPFPHSRGRSRGRTPHGQNHEHRDSHLVREPSSERIGRHAQVQTPMNMDRESTGGHRGQQEQPMDQEQPVDQNDQEMAPENRGDIQVDSAIVHVVEETRGENASEFSREPSAFPSGPPQIPREQSEQQQGSATVPVRSPRGNQLSPRGNQLSPRVQNLLISPRTPSSPRNQNPPRVQNSPRALDSPRTRQPRVVGSLNNIPSGLNHHQIIERQVQQRQNPDFNQKVKGFARNLKIQNTVNKLNEREKIKKERWERLQQQRGQEAQNQQGPRDQPQSPPAAAARNPRGQILTPPRLVLPSAATGAVPKRSQQQPRGQDNSPRVQDQPCVQNQPRVPQSPLGSELVPDGATAGPGRFLDDLDQTFMQFNDTIVVEDTIVDVDETLRPDFVSGEVLSMTMAPIIAGTEHEEIVRIREAWSNIISAVAKYPQCHVFLIGGKNKMDQIKAGQFMCLDRNIQEIFYKKGLEKNNIQTSYFEFHPLLQMGLLVTLNERSACEHAYAITDIKLDGRKAFSYLSSELLESSLICIYFKKSSPVWEDCETPIHVIRRFLSHNGINISAGPANHYTHYPLTVFGSDLPRGDSSNRVLICLVNKAILAKLKAAKLKVKVPEPNRNTFTMSFTPPVKVEVVLAFPKKRTVKKDSPGPRGRPKLPRPGDSNSTLTNPSSTVGPSMVTRSSASTSNASTGVEGPSVTSGPSAPAPSPVFEAVSSTLGPLSSSENQTASSRGPSGSRAEGNVVDPAFLQGLLQNLKDNPPARSAVSEEVVILDESISIPSLLPRQPTPPTPPGWDLGLMFSQPTSQANLNQGNLTEANLTAMDISLTPTKRQLERSRSSEDLNENPSKHFGLTPRKVASMASVSEAMSSDSSISTLEETRLALLHLSTGSSSSKTARLNLGNSKDAFAPRKFSVSAGPMETSSFNEDTEKPKTPVKIVENTIGAGSLESGDQEQTNKPKEKTEKKEDQDKRE